MATAGGDAGWSYRRLVTGDQPKQGPLPRLTTAELRVLAAVEDFMHEHGWAPTHRELAERLSWRSPGAVHNYLARLREKGVIEGSGRRLRVRDFPRGASFQAEPHA